MKRLTQTISKRPAESGGVASALAALIGYILGIHDPGILIAIAMVIGFVPAAITWLVTTLRKPPAPAPAGAHHKRASGKTAR